MRCGFVVSVTTLLALSGARADEPVRLREGLVPGAQYRVNSRVDITGKLTLPAEKGQAAKTLEITGKSAIDYDERILALGKDQQVEKTIRLFHKMDFQRKVGEQLQQYNLRPEIRRMVLLRHNQVEVPFSPDGTRFFTIDVHDHTSTFRVWNVPAGKLIKSFEIPFRSNDLT